MIDLSKYKEYRRIFPKIRLSWSLLNSGKLERQFDYLTGARSFTSAAMERGKRIHEQLEIVGIDKSVFKRQTATPILEQKFELELHHEFSFIFIPDVIAAPYLADYKAGSIKSGGYVKQLKFYNAALKAYKFNLLNYEGDRLEDFSMIETGMVLQVNDELEVADKRIIFFDDNENEAIIDKITTFGNNLLDAIKGGELDNYLKQE